MQSLLDAEVLEHLGGIALSLPTVHLGKLQFEVGRTVAVFLGHLGFGIDGLALLHVFPQRLMSHEHGVEHAIGIIFEVILLQDGKAFARPQFHGSLVGFQVSADGAEQGRLTGAVGPDDAVDISVGELQVYIFVKHSLSELNRKIRYCYHFF